MPDDLAALRARVAELERENAGLRTIMRAAVDTLCLSSVPLVAVGDRPWVIDSPLQEGRWVVTEVSSSFTLKGDEDE